MTAQNSELVAPITYDFNSLSLATSINTTQLRADAKAGKLRGRKIGKRWLFTREDALTYVNSLPVHQA